ncbi:MAG: hypothetical protein U0234_18635 [Sandaracinus sp.]
MSSDEARRRWCECPFFVLGVAVDAPRAEIERSAQRLLAELAVGREKAKTYWTPFGPRERTPELVRAAVAELRDPEKRLAHELWARVEPASATPPEGARWEGALEQLGLGRSAAR